MTKALEDFFSAWAIEDGTKRDAQIDGALGSSLFYADPRTEAPITDASALKGYVAKFSEMAPGMAVNVVHTSTTMSFARVAVQFGAGEMSQMGQYTADLDDAGKITRLIGFVGLGTPE